ncbi:DUF6930 domain-containing protein [Paenibacillus chartarius]|uniref:DUF6930 domain-containing protein n=1 Tax=Paenibacillus chartarius TaxID=747481 RepID=A0ABV6DHP4_9BACL
MGNRAKAAKSPLNIEVWGRLYEMASEFKRSRCWEWMEDIHIVAVKDPASSLTGYCSVLGRGGHMTGLAVYLGDTGLYTLQGMLSGSLDEDPRYIQHSLLLSFEDRRELYPVELKRIKELGLSYRGAGAWPSFRLFEPGYVPWPEFSDELAAFLTVAIEQTLQTASAYRSNPDDMLDPKGAFVTRVPHRTGTSPINWGEERIVPGPGMIPEDPEAGPLDQLQLAKLRKSLKPAKGALWEMDCFFLPMPIQEGDKPFYPLMLLVVDHESEMILHTALFEKSSAPREVTARMLELIQSAGILPEGLWAANPRVFDYMHQLITGLKLQAYVASELPVLEQAKSVMLHQFGR